MADVKQWVVSLEDGVPADLPVPNGHPFLIEGVHCTAATARKVVLEAIVQTIRLDRLEEDDDRAQVELTDTVLAILFPDTDPDAALNLTFSAYNTVSVRVTGGTVTVTGIYDPSEKLPTLDGPL